MTKRYDRSYFDKWYRGQDRVTSASEVRRKVTLAVAVCEYFLQRNVASVLDIGCGEGAWLQHLRALRPRVRYQGLDPSAYVVRTFGASRNIRRAAFGDLPRLDFDRQFDLVVCSDVLHYVNDEEIRAGARAIARLCRGIAYLEILTREDDIIGDLEGLIQRPASWYRKTFMRAGLRQVGPYCWIAPELQASPSGLEIPC